MGVYKSHEQFINELYIINPNIKVVDTYINSITKIKCECKICGNTWYMAPSKLLIGQGCITCNHIKRNRKLTKTHDKFIEELNHINPQIEVLGDYKNNSTNIRCRCKKDGVEWDAAPLNLLRGTGCPKCAGNTKKTQSQLQNYLR